MTLFDWLITPGGIEATHAVVLLIVAVTAYLNWRVKKAVDANAAKLNGHLEAHNILTGDPVSHNQ